MVLSKRLEEDHNKHAAFLFDVNWDKPNGAPCFRMTEVDVRCKFKSLHKPIGHSHDILFILLIEEHDTKTETCHGSHCVNYGGSPAYKSSIVNDMYETVPN